MTTIVVIFIHHYNYVHINVIFSAINAGNNNVIVVEQSLLEQLSPMPDFFTLVVGSVQLS
jgi:hypothetical protein